MQLPEAFQESVLRYFFSYLPILYDPKTQVEDLRLIFLHQKENGSFLISSKYLMYVLAVIRHTIQLTVPILHPLQFAFCNHSAI